MIRIPTGFNANPNPTFYLHAERILIQQAKVLRTRENPDPDRLCRVPSHIYIPKFISMHYHTGYKKKVLNHTYLNIGRSKNIFNGWRSGTYISSFFWQFHCNWIWISPGEPNQSGFGFETLKKKSQNRTYLSKSSPPLQYSRKMNCRLPSSLKENVHL